MSNKRFLMPEFEKPMGELFAVAIRTLAFIEEPLLAEVQIVTVDDLPEPSDVGVGDTYPGGIEMLGQTKISNILEVDVEAWTGLVSEISTQLAKGMIQMLLAGVRQSAEKVGNTVNFHGEPLSHDHLLDMLEMIDFDVDDDDNPVGLIMVSHPKYVEQFYRLPPPTQEQLNRWESIIAAKREASNAKKRNRTLD